MDRVLAASPPAKPRNSRLVVDLIPLHCLRNGQSAVVGQVLGRAELVTRLEEMGLRGGATVEMVQTGTPCIIRLAGHKLCFRADEATAVLVEVGAPR